jgi:hypothetical protein
VACFSSRNNGHQLTTFHHPFHHDLTTKTPRSVPTFSKTPLKNSSKNNKTPAPAGVSFFSQNNAKKLSLLSQEVPSWQQTPCR